MHLSYNQSRFLSRKVSQSSYWKLTTISLAVPDIDYMKTATTKTPENKIELTFIEQRSISQVKLFIFTY